MADDTIRKSHRLKIKDRGKHALSRSLKVKLSKESPEDEDMSVLQVKQARIPREWGKLNLERFRGRRTNNFLRVHNSYCTYDRVKYNGYDATFINDFVSTDSSSSEDLEDSVALGQGDKNWEMKRSFVSSSSGTEVEEPLTVHLGGSEGVVGNKRAKRGKLECVGGHSNEEELIFPARKLKTSVLSSDDSHPDSGELLSRARKPSSRALTVQARMKSDRDKQFASFRASRTRDETGHGAVTAVPNFGDIKRLLKGEDEVLPSAHKGLSEFCSCKELFGDSEDSLSGEDHHSPEHLKFIVESQPGSNENPPQPVVYEFSENSTEDIHITILDSDSDVERTLTNNPKLEPQNHSPNIFLSKYIEYEDTKPNPDTESFDHDLDQKKSELGNVEDSYNDLPKDLFDLEQFSPVSVGLIPNTLFTDLKTDSPNPVDHSSSDELEESPLVIDYVV